MTGVKESVFEPVAAHKAVYGSLYGLYRTLHDAFGVAGTRSDVSGVMKALGAIRREGLA